MENKSDMELILKVLEKGINIKDLIKHENNITKTCNKCGERYHKNYFHRNVINKDGLHSYCKSCRIKEKRQYDLDKYIARSINNG